MNFTKSKGSENTEKAQDCKFSLFLFYKTFVFVVEFYSQINPFYSAEKSIQKDTNCTTAESKDSQGSKLTLKETSNTLSKKSLEVKSKAERLKTKSHQKLGINVSHQCSPKSINMLTTRLSDNIKVSRRFISLIDEDEGDDSKLIHRFKTKIDKPKTIKRITEITQKISNVYKKHGMPKLILNHSASDPTLLEDAEENLVESPCPRPKVPAIKSYRKADEKSESTPDFKITPMLMTGCLTQRTNEIDLESSSNDSQIFDRAFSADIDESYELFNWCDEFDKIMDGTHKEVYGKHYGVQTIKQISLKNKKDYNPYVKYKCLKTYMTYKSNKIRALKYKKDECHKDQTKFEIDYKRVVPRKRNSFAPSTVNIADPTSANFVSHLARF